MLVLVSAVVLKWHRLALALALNDQLHPSPSLHPDPSPSPNPIQVLKWQRTLRLMDGLFEQIAEEETAHRVSCEIASVEWLVRRRGLEP